MPRDMWKGTLSFGLVAVPVRMVSAVRDNDVHFHLVDEKTGERIKVHRIAEADGEDVRWEEIGHGYDLDGQLVTLTDEELASAAPERTHTIEVEEFVDFDQIDPRQFDRQYFLLPESSSQGATRAYRLLRDAMAKSGQAAIGRVVMRSSEYLVAVREREGVLSLATLLFADELRSVSEIPDIPSAEVAKPKRGEVAQAAKLIDAMTTDFDPARYDNLHRERLLALVDSKRGATKETKSAVKQQALDAPSPAVDLMAALKASIAHATAK